MPGWLQDSFEHMEMSFSEMQSLEGLGKEKMACTREAEAAESPSRGVRKAGERCDCCSEGGLPQRERFLKIRHLLVQIFLDSECPLCEKHDTSTAMQDS